MKFLIRERHHFGGGKYLRGILKDNMDIFENDSNNFN